MFRKSERIGLVNIVWFVFIISSQIVSAQYNHLENHGVSRKNQYRYIRASVDNIPGKISGNTEPTELDASDCQNQVSEAKLLSEVQHVTSLVSDTKSFVESGMASGATRLFSGSPKKLFSLTNEAVSGAFGLSKLVIDYKPQCSHSSSKELTSAVTKLKTEESGLTSLVSSFAKDPHGEISAASALLPLLSNSITNSVNKILKDGSSDDGSKKKPDGGSSSSDGGDLSSFGSDGSSSLAKQVLSGLRDSEMEAFGPQPVSSVTTSGNSQAVGTSFTSMTAAKSRVRSFETSPEYAATAEKTGN